MDLLVVEQLEGVLDFSKQQVSSSQLSEFVSSQEIQICQTHQTVECAYAAYVPVFVAVAELQELGDELDVAD